MSTTTNYGWTKPTVGGDTDAWGGELNTDLDSIDATVFAVSGVANAALPKAGGTMTGALHAAGEDFVHTAVTPAAGTATCDLSLGNSFSFTVSGATTIALTNLPASGKFFQLRLEITNGGSAALTYFSGVRTPGGSGVGVLTAAGKDVLYFTTRDAGANWLFEGSRLNLS